MLRIRSHGLTFLKTPVGCSHTVSIGLQLQQTPSSDSWLTSSKPSSHVKKQCSPQLALPWASHLHKVQSPEYQTSSTF